MFGSVKQNYSEWVANSVDNDLAPISRAPDTPQKKRAAERFVTVLSGLSYSEESDMSVLCVKLAHFMHAVALVGNREDGYRYFGLVKHAMVMKLGDVINGLDGVVKDRLSSVRQYLHTMPIPTPGDQ